MRRAWTITDGRDIVVGGYPHPRTWPSPEEAEDAMQGLCWHPKRYNGPFQVVPCLVQETRQGTTLAVTLA